MELLLGYVIKIYYFKHAHNVDITTARSKFFSFVKPEKPPFWWLFI
jgi:hypothetical protein